MTDSSHNCELCEIRQLLKKLQEPIFRLTGYAHSEQDQKALVTEARGIYDILVKRS